MFDSGYIPVFQVVTLLIAALAFAARVVKNGNKIDAADGFYIFWFFSILYYVFGQLSQIHLDDFSEQVYISASIYVAFSFFCLFCFVVLTPLLDKRKYDNSPILSSRFSFIFLLGGSFCLGVGYVFWYLNYSRVGDITQLFVELGNRVDRNEFLTETRGNLPYTHFMYVANIMLLAGLLLKGESIKKSLFYSFASVSPMILFFFVEGERTALLKHFIAAFFVIQGLRWRKPFNIKFKTAILATTAFCIFGLLGNFRTGVGIYLQTGDTNYFHDNIEKHGWGLLIPREFVAVNFTLNKLIADEEDGKRELLYGSSYAFSVPYLFPRSVYDLFGLKKDGTIADKFGEQVAKEIGRERKMGFGMSALGEGFINFHYLGGFVFFLALLLFIKLLNASILSASPHFAVAAALVTPMLLLVHRTAFASAFSFAAWVTAIFVFSFLASMIFTQLVPKRKTRVEVS